MIRASIVNGTKLESCPKNRVEQFFRWEHRGELHGSFCCRILPWCHLDRDGRTASRKKNRVKFFRNTSILSPTIVPPRCNRYTSRNFQPTYCHKMDELFAYVTPRPRYTYIDRSGEKITVLLPPPSCQQP